MSEFRKCPKCGYTMKAVSHLVGHGRAVRLVKFGDLYGDKVIPSYCEKCRYIELYNEKNVETKQL